MKKKLSIIFSIVAVVVFAFFALASGSSDSGESKETQVAGEAVADELVTDEKNANTLGDYQVEIKNARITANWEGKPSVVITYGFTNNSNEPAAFWLALDDNVYQGGVGLEGAYTLKDGDPYDDANQNKEIKSGVTIDVDVAYILNDTETDIEVEVAELYSFDDAKVSRVFSIK